MKVVYGILTKLGIECATVSNGSDALAVATTCGEFSSRSFAIFDALLTSLPSS